MMIVAAVKIFNVQRDARRRGKAVEPMVDHFAVPLADALRGETNLPDHEGSPRNIK